MNKIVRILNVRKHKKVTFLDVYENFMSRLQLLCYNNLLVNINLSAGDILSFEGVESVNNKGLSIIEVKEIYWHNPTIEWCSPKGVYNPFSSSIEEIRYNARNNGKQIRLYYGKLFALSSIKKLLVSKDFLEIKCKSIEEKRTSAKRQPLEVTSIHLDSPLFLRITMENELKQTCAILLQSVFSIDNVFYDKMVTANVDREVCVLELVSIKHSTKDLIQLIVNIDTILREIFFRLKLSDFGYVLPDNITVIDYSELIDKNIDYTKFQNTVMLNVPVSSPFIKQDESGLRTEFQWIVRGKMLAHGYDDEFEYKNLLTAVNCQKMHLGLDDCNQMEYMKYAVPRTTSLGLGVDQLLYRFWNLEHIINISNPLGICSE